ncbi:hypothetical protein, partial [Micromonospora sp. CP22]|uniref:hypothetical protein n=1 Tax=Micromonospora sp. CP22 TaxID=2580517 RepID=UPI001E63C6C7
RRRAGHDRRHSRLIKDFSSTSLDYCSMIVPEGESDLPLINVTLWFSDPVGSWKAGPQGVERVDETSRKPVFGYGVELSEERETAADCGEG